MNYKIINRIKAASKAEAGQFRFDSFVTSNVCCCIACCFNTGGAAFP